MRSEIPSASKVAVANGRATDAKIFASATRAPPAKVVVEEEEEAGRLRE